MIFLTCPSCLQTVNARTAAGQSIECPHCHESIRVPAHGNRKTKIVVGLGIVAGLLAAAGSLHMMGVFTPGATAQHTIRSTDGISTIQVPLDWYPGTMNDHATIQVGNQFKEVYLVVLSDAKVDFAEVPTLAEFARVMLDNSPCDNTVLISGPDERLINGRKALQYEFNGTIKQGNVRIHVLDTAVEGERHFHHIMTWTLVSRFPQHRPRMEEAINSFRELPKP